MSVNKTMHTEQRSVACRCRVIVSVELNRFAWPGGFVEWSASRKCLRYTGEATASENRKLLGVVSHFDLEMKSSQRAERRQSPDSTPQRSRRAKDRRINVLPLAVRAGDNACACTKPAPRAKSGDVEYNLRSVKPFVPIDSTLPEFQRSSPMSSYGDNLNILRRAFPQPVSDQEHDAWFVFSVLRALDRVDAMKSQRPILGEPKEINFAAAVEARVPEAMSTVELVSRDLVDHLAGMFIWGHPRAQVNVINPPCIPGILGTLLPAIYNPNLCSEEASRGVALAEAEVVSMTAELMGYDPSESGGVFTFGGTGTLLYAIRLGIEKALPGTMQTGMSGDLPVVVCSDQAHYAVKTAASWLGLGLNNVIPIPTAPNNEIRICLLESELRRLLKEGRRIACIVATMGTTDAFGLDSLEQIHQIRDDLVREFSLDYVPHLHADAVIGWAWSVFRDYDFSQNALEFPDRTLRALAGTNRRMRHLHLADSIGVDYHKTGFAPYISSAFFVKHGVDLHRLSRDQSTTPYLFQSGEYNPGRFTLETSRSGSGPMAALGCIAVARKNRTAHLARSSGDDGRDAAQSSVSSAVNQRDERGEFRSSDAVSRLPR